jgi:hypothetical protein
MRKMVDDPPPTLNLNMLGVPQVLARIKLELSMVCREHPELTPNQQLMEARRRCWQALVALADVREAKEQRARGSGSVWPTNPSHKNIGLWIIPSHWRPRAGAAHGRSLASRPQSAFMPSTNVDAQARATSVRYSSLTLSTQPASMTNS